MHTQVPDNVLYELLQRVAKGDIAAFAALFFAMHDTIYNRAKGLVGDGNEAAHIAQGVFVEIWQRAPFAVESGSVGVWQWAFGITGRRCADRACLRRVPGDGCQQVGRAYDDHIGRELALLLAAGTQISPGRHIRSPSGRPTAQPRERPT